MSRDHHGEGLRVRCVHGGGREGGGKINRLFGAGDSGGDITRVASLRRTFSTPELLLQRS